MLLLWYFSSILYYITLPPLPILPSNWNWSVMKDKYIMVEYVHTHYGRVNAGTPLQHVRATMQLTIAGGWQRLCTRNIAAIFLVHSLCQPPAMVSCIVVLQLQIVRAGPIVIACSASCSTQLQSCQSGCTEINWLRPYEMSYTFVSCKYVMQSMPCANLYT